MKRGEASLNTLLEPIQDLLDDSRITNIVCQREHEVGYCRDGQWEWRDVPSFDFNTLDAIGIKASNLMSKRFDPDHPIIDTHLPGGHRYAACRPPATKQDIAFTIRVPARGFHRPIGDLVDIMEMPKGTARRDVDGDLLELFRAQDWSRFFELAVRARKTIAATGLVNSGKTTFLKDRMQAIPPHERVITIEDSPEFGDLPVRNRVALFFGSANISADYLVETVLRKAPDRIAIQELRGGEAYAFIRLQTTGHGGSLTSWHATRDDPWTPLCLMAKSSEKGRAIPDEKLHEMVRSFVDIVAYCERDPGDPKIVHAPAHVYWKGAQ